MTRLYRILVGILLPGGFRRRYGEEMEAFFAQGRAELSGWRRWRFTARALVDLGGTAVAARLETRVGNKGPGWLGGLGRDVRHGARALRRHPGFSAAAVLTVALGIGAATAVFTVVDGVILRPLPFAEPDRLVSLWTTFDNTGDTPFGVSLAVQHDYLEETRAFETLGGFAGGEVTLTGVGRPRQVPVARIWKDVFGVTGIGVQAGRLPRPEELTTGAEPVALATAPFWRQALGGDPDAVGRVLRLDGRSVRVVGVLEEDAWLPGVEDALLWLPVQLARTDITDRSGHFMFALARLAPGTTLQDARRERDGIQAAWREAWAGHHSPGHPGHDIRMEAAHAWYFGELRSLGSLLLGAAGLLLLLACANVAALLLARGEGRRAEMAVRRALGAERGRLARGLLVEHGLLAVAGGAAGLLLAVVGTDALLTLAPEGLPRVAEVGVDGRVALFAVAATAAAGLLFGAFPAVRGARLPSSGRRVSGPAVGLTRSLHLLVAGQIALSVVLVSGAGLLARSVAQVLSVEAGAETSGRIVATLSLPEVRYPGSRDAVAYWEAVLREVEAAPEVGSVAMTRTLPFRDELRREGMVLEGDDGRYSDAMPIASQVVSAGYFDVAGIPVVQGRGLGPADGPDGRKVAVVNETAARRYFPGGAVGRVVQPLWVTREHGPVEIVGVVADVRHEDLRSEASPELYRPLAQVATNEASWIREGTLVLRPRAGIDGAVTAVRAAAAGLDPEIPVEDVEGWDDLRAGSVARERFTASIVGVFSLLALLLASVGTYGVISFVTAHRVREVGVRLALGAERSRVVRELLRRAAVVSGAGVVAGGMLAATAAPLLEAFLYRGEVRDPVVLLAAPVLLAAVSLAAAAIPAIRAGGTDPATALRAEE